VLFNYLLLHSDDQLRALLFMSCSQFMALPVLSWNYWPEGENEPDQISEKKEFIPRRLCWVENLYVFEKHKALLNLKFAPCSDDLPLGATAIINRLCGKNFLSHSDWTVDQGVVEMQYDHNCKVTEYTVVADAHGLLPTEEAALLAPLFD